MTRRSKVLGITAFVCIIGLNCALLFLTSSGHYVLALAMEARWVPADPRTRQELESHLYLCTTTSIEPSESMWGSAYVLKPGERMLQYRIMGDPNCPLDVVLDEEERIQAIFTSYE